MGCQSESRLTNNNYNIERKELRQTIQNNRANSTLQQMKMSPITSTAKDKQTTIQFSFQFVLFNVVWKVSHSLRVQSTDFSQSKNSSIQFTTKKERQLKTPLRVLLRIPTTQIKTGNQNQNISVCIHSSNTGIIYNIYTGYSQSWCLTVNHWSNLFWCSGQWKTQIIINWKKNTVTESSYKSGFALVLFMLRSVMGSYWF